LDAEIAASNKYSEHYYRERDHQDLGNQLIVPLSPITFGKVGQSKPIGKAGFRVVLVPSRRFGRGRVHLGRAPPLKVSDTHADRLGLKIILEHLASHLAAPSRLLVAAKRHRSIEYIVAIHPDSTGAQLIGDAMGSLDAARP
jgi:hypothetical protein